MSEIKNVQKLVEILHRNCKLSLEQIATMADMTVAEAGAAIEELEKNGTILGYGATINWDNLPENNTVTAYVELKVTPQRHTGFSQLAERICQYPEVKSLSLVSGSYDFGITVNGKSIQDVASFVAEHLATIESVISTATRFVLKRYKSDGVIFTAKSEDDREVLSL